MVVWLGWSLAAGGVSLLLVGGRGCVKAAGLPGRPALGGTGRRRLLHSSIIRNCSGAVRPSHPTSHTCACRVSGYQGILFNLGRPLARGATILGAQDKEYTTHGGEMLRVLMHYLYSPGSPFSFAQSSARVASPRAAGSPCC